MSSVVISNRAILNQKVSSIEKNKVALPFNVSKEQIQKIVNLLSKIKVKFSTETDNLKISELSYNDINVKTNDRQLNNCSFALAKTYVVTMKQSFISKVKSFYDRLVEIKEPERPIFNISNETNLQEALQEATAEIDLSAINATLNENQNLQDNNINAIQEPEQASQVLANSPLGETIIENPINLNEAEQQLNTVVETKSTEPVAPETVTPVTLPQEPQVNTTVPVESVTEVNNVAQTPQVQPQENNPPVAAEPVTQVAPVSATPEVVNPTPEVTEQPGKVRTKKLKGNVLAIPIVVVWLGLVFYGTMKVVTGILT